MNKRVFLPMLLCVLSLGACATKGQAYNVEDYMSELPFHEGFDILQLSDLHLSSQRNLEEDYNYLTGLVQKFKENNGGKDADLIVFTGDLFTFASKLTIEKTFETFDSWGIPWTLTFGNHDEQLFADFEFAAYAASKCKNCVFNYLHDDMTGLTNSIINLKEGEETKFQIFMVDSNTYSYQGGIGYDWVHEDQLDWYEEAIKYENKKYDQNWQKGSENTIKSFIFQHIPLVEFKEAYEGYIANPPKYDGDGENHEGNSPAKYNSGFYDRIKANKSTRAVVVGHDHINTTDIDFNKDGYSVHFIYGVKSTDNIYHDDDGMGYRSFKIYSDGSFSTETHFYNYKLEEVRL